MGHIRFQIGMPRVGSAARSAEQEGMQTPPAGRLVLPKAGSSARAVEAEKAALRSAAPSQAGLSFQSTKGRVMLHTPVTTTTFNRPEMQAPSLDVGSNATSPSPQNISEPPPPDGRDVTAAPSPTGPLQIAANRFQTLVRSLFSAGRHDQ